MPLGRHEGASGFVLRDLRGEERRLPEKGSVLLVFYKVSCPTCQLTLPFIGRMHRAYGSALSFLGVGQDPPEEVSLFAERYRLDFPQLPEPPPYEVSSAYEVQVVPTLYLIEEGRILRVEESFVKSSLASLNEELARRAGTDPLPLFEGVSVPPFKPG